MPQLGDQAIFIAGADACLTVMFSEARATVILFTNVVCRHQQLSWLLC